MWTNDVHAVECAPFVSGRRGKLGGRRKEIMRIVSVPLLVHYVPACMLGLTSKHRQLGGRFRPRRAIQKWRSRDPRQCPHNPWPWLQQHGVSSGWTCQAGYICTHFKTTTLHLKNSLSSMISTEIK
nr:uncharacterized protein LOC129382935 [Dermacentor andersoni]